MSSRALAPWRLLERGTEWILAPKSELLELLFWRPRAPLKEILSEEHKAVLLVTIGHRRKGGVSKRRVGEILGLEASSYLDNLLSQGLIYCDPPRELNFWRPTPLALLALGLRSHTDIPALKELEEWFDSQKEIRTIERRFATDVNHQISNKIVGAAKRTESGIALRAGVLVRFVDPRNTSRTCPKCGCVYKRNRKSQAEFRCVACGYTDNADSNAAENIRRAAVNPPNVAGVDVSGVLRKKVPVAKRSLVTSCLL